ncbi:unnamed protein product [Vicia faba]|uniref:FYVE-type domain-containing protein n=1 Tax=Vicia faba TaxID=3906 RepID=A0AAV0YY78_VICFA|nr:unnamed protein product [Vicia faba]
MEDKNFDSKNHVQVVEDLSDRVSRLSPCDHIFNSYSPLDDEVDGNLRNHHNHVTKENSDSLSSVSTEENNMNLSRLYPELPEESLERNEEDMEALAGIQNQRKYFYYDAPLNEDTGVWIPVSVPPMLEDDHKEWTKGFHSSGGFFPEDDMGWNQYVGGDKELTMWEVLVEILLVARGKVSSLASGDIHTYSFSWLSSHVLEQAWREMAQTLTETSFGNVKELIEAEPPKWLADSAAASCMLCGVRFHPIMCSRHHCRFCGGIFCGECSKGRSLMPSKFRVSDPQRVCDVCFVRVESIQPYLMDHTMEYEIYKATNTIKSYNQIGLVKPDKTIPDVILRQAKGLAIITVAKVGVMVTYNIGTGIVVARREDGSWSPPSAVSTFGMGWGAQAGGELTDFIIVLRTNDAVKTFSGNAHLSLGAGLSAAVGVVGRAAEADIRAGDGGYAACYTYSCSKGAFVGCSLEGSIVTTRTQENSRFYGSQSLTATDILLGSLPRPPAAAILYRALAELYLKIDGY